MNATQPPPLLPRSPTCSEGEQLIKILPDLNLDVHLGHLHLLSGLLYCEHIQGKDTIKNNNIKL